jgi:hypothetical protein
MGTDRGVRPDGHCRPSLVILATTYGGQEAGVAHTHALFTFVCGSSVRGIFLIRCWHGGSCFNLRIARKPNGGSPPLPVQALFGKGRTARYLDLTGSQNRVMLLGTKPWV